MASEISPDVDSATPPDNQENNEDSDESSHPEENNDSTEPATPTQQEPVTPLLSWPSPFYGGFKCNQLATERLDAGYSRRALLQGDINNAKARSHAKSDKEKLAWKKLKGTISQDAFIMLLTNIKELQEKYGIFTSD